MPNLPFNTKDNHAKIHEKEGCYEIWIHHQNSLIEFVNAFTNYNMAKRFANGYNGQDIFGNENTN